MAHITDEILTQAITSLPGKFDTHDVIQKVTQIAPRQYADDLGATAGEDPFITLHGQIGKHLLTIPGIEPTKKVVSLNIRGQENENQQWRKI